MGTEPQAAGKVAHSAAGSCINGAGGTRSQDSAKRSIQFENKNGQDSALRDYFVSSLLGWPALLGGTLAGHEAGMPIYAKSNELFRRQTDEVVREALGKSPLEVGADRIARTAIAALSLLADLGVLIGTNITLAWEAVLGKGVRAIEVYPAGTLRAYQLVGVVSSSMSSDQAKQSLVSKLKKKGRIRFDKGSAKAIDNEHVLDSVLCALAATDFIEKRAIFPATDRQKDLARKEGWIWVRDPGAK